jgi:glycosyltransferase involved in cell wall biosynthesis
MEHRPTVPKKIAFVKSGAFSHTNDRTLQAMKREFSELEIEVIDIEQDLVQTKEVGNLLAVMKMYGLDILAGKKKAWECLVRTTYIFKKIKRAVIARLAKDDYAFSFQTQSLFDASVPGLPHFVYTDHTHLANLDNPIFDRNKLFPAVWVQLEKTIYHNATLNFTMSHNISDSMIRHYGCDPKKVVCVYAGNNAVIDNIKNDLRKYAKKHILFVGVNWIMKGGPELAEAFKKVLQVHPDAKLTIVGCSPRLDLPNCHVVGRIPVEEVSKYYEQASVFCLPTRTEALGIVFIEALTHKLPIVANNIEAVPDFVEHGRTGYLMKPNNIEELANALIDLLGNPKKCQAFGERGYRIVAEKYSWEKVGARLKENIETAINNRTPYRC